MENEIIINEIQQPSDFQLPPKSSNNSIDQKNDSKDIVYKDEYIDILND